MIQHGHAWVGEDDGTLMKVAISVERTDSDEVAIFARADDVETTALYVSVETATRLGLLLGIAAHAHEIQAHEAAKIVAADA